MNYFQFNVVSQPDPANPANTITKLLPGVHGLFSGGLVIDLLIGVDAVTTQLLQSENVIVPSPIIVKGLFDTGCTITSIDSSLISALDLKTTGFSDTGTANGMTTVSQHVASITFPGTKLSGKPVHQVQSVNLAGQPIQALIGRDLMAFWTVTYNGLAGFVSIAD